MAETTGTLQFASGLSEAPLSAQAVREVLADLEPQLDGPADLVVLFATSHHAGALQQVASQLRTRLGAGLIAGMTVEGVVGTGREVQASAGLSVMAARLPGTQLLPFRYSNDGLAMGLLREDGSSTWSADQARHVQDVRGLMLLADPFSTPMASAVKALSTTWPGVPVFGGLASASDEPLGNRLLLGEKLTDVGGVGVAFAGNIDVHCTVSQGCRPIGRPMVITGARRHVIQQLAGRPALELLRETIEAMSFEERTLAEHQGLCIGRVINEYKSRFGQGDFLIRNIVSVDPEGGFLAVSDPFVRVGQTVQFQLRDAATAEADLRLLLEAQKLHDGAGGAMLFTCNSRGTMLFDEPHVEPKLICDALGDLPLAGGFVAGELGPIDGDNFLLGHSASLVVLRERNHVTPIV